MCWGFHPGFGPTVFGDGSPCFLARAGVILGAHIFESIWAHLENIKHEEYDAEDSFCDHRSHRSSSCECSMEEANQLW
jgi:hypothetical protein